MRPVGGFVLVVVVLASGARASDSTFVEGYHGAIWGMSERQTDSVFETAFGVKHKMRIEGGERSYFIDTIADVEFTIRSLFHEDSLYWVHLSSRDTTLARSNARSAHAAIALGLVKKYGEPLSDSAFKMPAHGGALEMQSTTWSTTETRITLFVSTRKGDDYGILMLAYTCKEIVESVVAREE